MAVAYFYIGAMFAIFTVLGAIADFLYYLPDIIADIIDFFRDTHRDIVRARKRKQHKKR